jgi:hypothetical protein
MKATPNEKEPAVSSYRPEGKNTTLPLSFASPEVKSKGQKDSYDKALQSTRARVFDWLALEAAHRGKSWTRKNVGHVAWIKTNPGNNTRVLHWVGFHWYGRGVLRSTNKSGLCLPKSFWHRCYPEASEEFELSLLPEELLGMDPKKLFDFLEWHNDPKNRPESDVKLSLDFAPEHDGFGYAWTKAACERFKPSESQEGGAQ